MFRITFYRPDGTQQTLDTVCSFVVEVDNHPEPVVLVAGHEVGLVREFACITVTHITEAHRHYPEAHRHYPEAPDAYQSGGRGLKDNGEF